MTKKSEEKQQAQDNNTLQLSGTPEKLIPKYASNVFFQLAKDKLLMTFTYKDNPEDKVNTVIERIVVDIEHAHKVLQVLQDVLKKETNEQ